MGQARTTSVRVSTTRRLATVGVMLLAAAGWGSATDQPVDRPSAGAGGRAASVRSSGAESSGISRGDASVCFTCHRFESVLSHPVNVRPSLAMPVSFPLQGGLITCQTCHDAGTRHTSLRAPVGVRGGKAGAGLCVQCHQGTSGSTSSSHAIRLGKAHFQSSNGTLLAARTTGLDAESRSCLACHDGTAASDTGAHTFRNNNLEPASEHPVGVPLRATLTRIERDFGLVSVATLDKRVRLANGVIGCGSCHSVYSREKSQLVMSNQKSRLCLSCHTQ